MANTFDWPLSKPSYVDQFYKKFVEPDLVSFQKKLSEPLPTLNFKNNLLGFDKTLKTQITMPAANGLGSNLFKDKVTSSTGTLGSSDDTKSWLSKMSPDLLSIAPDILDGGLKVAGAKEAELSSMAEGLWEKGSKAAFQTSVKTGNPIAMVATGVPYALSLLNKYGGKTTNTQNTLGLDTGPYTTEISDKAGKKATMIGTYGTSLLGGIAGVLGRKTTLGKNLFGNSKLDNINASTARADNKNLLSSTVGYANKKNLMSAQNTIQNIASKNNQQLMGGITFAKQGSKLTPVNLRVISNRVKSNLNKKVITSSQEVTQENVIPEGALHARKNNYEGELAEQVTSKGIPVITYEEDGKIIQHAEIENSEIIFHKETTNKLENWFEEYKNADDARKKIIEIDCGKFLTEEILENTVDNVGLLE